MTLLFEFVFEFLIQIVVELFVDSAVSNVSGRQWRRFFLALLYLAGGAAVGAVSLWIFPQHFIDSRQMRLLGLIATPIVTGLAMVLIGHLRAMQGGRISEIERFSTATAFAFGLAAVRYWFAD